MAATNDLFVAKLELLEWLKARDVFTDAEFKAEGRKLAAQSLARA